MSDSALHMLRYWVEDKGIETALTEYYPELVKDDKLLRTYFNQYKLAKAMILQRVNQIVEDAQNDIDEA